MGGTKKLACRNGCRSFEAIDSRDGFPRPRQAFPQRVAPQQSSSPFRLTTYDRLHLDHAPCSVRNIQSQAPTISGELQFPLECSNPVFECVPLKRGSAAINISMKR